MQRRQNYQIAQSAIWQSFVAALPLTAAGKLVVPLSTELISAK